jgi:hypothetical protein
MKSGELGLGEQIFRPRATSMRSGLVTDAQAGERARVLVSLT